jgi:hypothetical protein
MKTFLLKTSKQPGPNQYRPLLIATGAFIASIIGFTKGLEPLSEKIVCLSLFLGGGLALVGILWYNVTYKVILTESEIIIKDQIIEYDQIDSLEIRNHKTRDGNIRTYIFTLENGVEKKCTAHLWKNFQLENILVNKLKYRIPNIEEIFNS